MLISKNSGNNAGAGNGPQRSHYHRPIAFLPESNPDKNIDWQVF
ncbi:hypothetical protein [Dyadobacter chenwenxiniae]|nr:hypothetical protein [Dyadobacter chenwenxiniae]